MEPKPADRELVFPGGSVAVGHRPSAATTHDREQRREQHAPSERKGRYRLQQPVGAPVRHHSSRRASPERRLNGIIPGLRRALHKRHDVSFIEGDLRELVCEGTWTADDIQTWKDRAVATKCSSGCEGCASPPHPDD